MTQERQQVSNIWGPTSGIGRRVCNLLECFQVGCDRQDCRPTNTKVTTITQKVQIETLYKIQRALIRLWAEFGLRATNRFRILTLMTSGAWWLWR